MLQDTIQYNEPHSKLQQQLQQIGLLFTTKVTAKYRSNVEHKIVDFFY